MPRGMRQDGQKVGEGCCSSIPFRLYRRSVRAVMRSADGLERGRKTEAATGGRFEPESEGSRASRIGEARRRLPFSA